MHLIFYSAHREKAGQQLRKTLEAMVPADDLATCASLNELSCRLLEPACGPTVAILLASTRNELLGLVAIAHLFRDIRIILVLPDRETNTVSLGHSLRPRFLTYADSHFDGPVAAVLEKMLQTAKC